VTDHYGALLTMIERTIWRSKSYHSPLWLVRRQDLICGLLLLCTDRFLLYAWRNMQRSVALWKGRLCGRINKRKLWYWSKLWLLLIWLGTSLSLL
jgi:hypothetical protein